MIGCWNNINIENVINLCCHQLDNLLITGDENGNIRLFKYPCIDQNASFYYAKQSSNACTEARFLKKDSNCIVTSSFDGSLFIWDLV